MTKKKKNDLHGGIMNIHHITKSLFVGAAIAGIGMSSGRADITFDEGFRQNVKEIIIKVMGDRYKALNALYPNTLSKDQLQKDVEMIYNSLFDRDTGFAHYFTDAFYNAHNTPTEIRQLYEDPEQALASWFGRNGFHESCEGLPDNVKFQGNAPLHIRTAVASIIKKLTQKDANFDENDIERIVKTGRRKRKELDALQREGFVTRCYCWGIDGWGMNSYEPRMYREVEKLSYEIEELWYPYVLERFDDNRRKVCEVEPMLCNDQRNSSLLSRAFLRSLLKNYSRYLTIKRALQNNEFSSDIYEMYIKFKEFNEALKQTALLERASSRTGKSGDGIVSYIGPAPSDDWRKCHEEKHWRRMMTKLEEIERLCNLVDRHPEPKRLSRRSRKMMHIWADADNR